MLKIFRCVIAFTKPPKECRKLPLALTAVRSLESDEAWLVPRPRSCSSVRGSPLFLGLTIVKAVARGIPCSMRTYGFLGC